MRWFVEVNSELFKEIEKLIKDKETIIIYYKLLYISKYYKYIPYKLDMLSILFNNNNINESFRMLLNNNLIYLYNEEQLLNNIYNININNITTNNINKIDLIYNFMDIINSNVNNYVVNKDTFNKPSIEEITKYISNKGYKINPVTFYNFYESNGWRVGKNKMKDWKASIRKWESQKQDDISNGKKNVVDTPAWYKGVAENETTDDSGYVDLKDILGDNNG